MILLANCDDCNKKARVRTCEIHNPKGAKICKRCCITNKDGHHCAWFSLCW